MRFKGLVKKWIYGSMPGFAGRFPYFGTTVYFPKNSHIFDRACAAGIYEQEILGLLWKLIDLHSWYFDVGANIGLLSVPILKALSSCRVVSFEPSPNALPYLARTASESSFADRWTVIGQALGATCSTTRFCVNDPSMGAYDGVHDTGRVPSKNTVTVEMTTIDKVWQDLGRPKVSMIKIDVEGFEIEVLKGALHCLKAQRPFVLLEWNSANLKANQVDPDALLDFAETHGFAVFSANNLMPVVNRAGLRLQMRWGIENFLIAPESGAAGREPSWEGLAESAIGKS